MLNLFRNQPRAFPMIFILEFWERFGFYTVQGILTLYFIRYLGYSDVDAYYTFGAFSALVYGLVLFGGYLGDKILGAQRTIVLGLILLVLGYSYLAFADKEQIFFAMGLICVGNGVFKANPSNLLSKCYEPQDKRLHSGFTLYYMSINLGSIIALFAGPALSSLYGYSYAYFFSAIGLAIGLANYYFQRQLLVDVKTPVDKRPIPFWLWILIVLGITILTFGSAFLLQHVHLAKNLLWLGTSIAIFFYGNIMSKENKTSRMKMLVAFILMFEAVLFFTLYQQMPTSLNLFAVHNVNTNLFGIHIDPQSFQALNPIWIVIMSPVLAYFYTMFLKKKISFNVTYKFACGMTLSGISFLMLYFARYFYVGDGIVSFWWLIFSYFFQSVGELMISALGVAMVAELVPARIAGTVMGIWFLTSAIAGFLGAAVASYTALPNQMEAGVESLLIYTQVFAYIGIATLVIALLIWLSAPFLSRYIDENQDLTKDSSPSDVLNC